MMPASRKIARFNRRFTNKVFSRLAGRTPGFAVMVHVGRKPGRTHRTPVNAFATDDGFLIALTYGPESDWVGNIPAAGSRELRARGKRVRMKNSRIATDRKKRWAALPVKFILGLINAPQCMRLSREETR